MKASVALNPEIHEEEEAQQAELARERTDLAWERNLLALERTLSAWVRTGLAALAAGIGIAELLPPPDRVWWAPAISAVFVLAGVASFAAGIWRYYRVRAELRQQGMRPLPAGLVAAICAALVVGAVLALVLVLMS